ncbi:hypothetical protein Q3G72_005480 [Acer saccharum]|nr:hypothetical protein Q3G72_005480 [Acer saccharum]
MTTTHEIKMEDGIMVKTEVVYNNYYRKEILRHFLKQMYETSDMVVGFDMEWSSVLKNCSDLSSETKVVLLKLCNGVGCVLINLDQQDTNHTSYLNNLLANDDVIFAGVHLKERLKQLRKTYGFEIKNAVDLSVMAASVLHQPRFGAYGVRRLASDLLCQPWKPRPLSITDEKWKLKDCYCRFNKDQIECATVDAYAAYKIAKRLLSEEIVPRTFDFISL